MTSNKSLKRLALLCGASLLIAVPSMVFGSPESILPPGFGDSDSPKPSSKPAPSKPAETQLRLPTDLIPEDGSANPSRPKSTSGAASSSSVASTTGDAEANEEEGEDEEIPILVDLPPSARRSIDQVGVLTANDGDMGADAFGQADGRYLRTLLRHMDAPIVSRWGNIILRRALLSRMMTPPNANGADWVADRAWLLLRMGEADSARLLVQSVDTDRFTPWLQEIGLQTSLANADPALACPMVEGALTKSKAKGWKMQRAICAALSGESPQAAAQIDALRDRREVKGVDILLAEKVVGAGGNARRSVKIEWEDVPYLTAWRYGLATSTALPIPDKLMAGAGPRVSAWRAKAPLLSFSARQKDADVAAALGVFSSAALVDHYAAMAEEEDVQEAQSAVAESLRLSYAAPSASAKVDAMRTLWGADNLTSLTRFARYIMTARAAAILPVSADHSSDVDGLIFSMLSAGLDVQAARWSQVAADAGGTAGTRALAMLSVGSPRPMSGFDGGDVSGFSGQSENAPKLLFAGLAGLGRLSQSDTESLAEDLDVPIGRASPWTQAMDRAIAAGERGTVAVLAAAALQTSDWSKVRAEYFYRAVLGLRQVGLEAEARMLAAEAVARS